IFILMTTLDFQHELVNIQDSLMRFAYSLTLNKEDAEDLVQETSLKALKHRDKFVYKSSLKAWTFTILKNTFINNYRRSRKKSTYPNQSIEHSNKHYFTASQGYNPDSIFSSNEIEETIEALDEHFKKPLKMHYVGYKYKEIAEILNLNIGTVKSRIYFSRKKLVKKLQGYN
ncbi:MAG: RNA polymerase sigma factor, partial [Bacteroidales bacterium]|nr:RNA polymerase sigma factor [Bacteroidales bacterium]